jgi:2-polyprenyl-3-methyl-5-hydroxy-6-metoxy-1,4-benzoquinol methylase
MENSLERINPQIISHTDMDTLKIHLDRYKYASLHLAPGHIADIACGVGYGSYILATDFGEKIQSIKAVDSDPGSIEIAKATYNHSKINYEISDALNFQSQNLFNTIISLETIEHLQNPGDFIRHISTHLLQKGRFIASVPITPSMDANPFHLTDFTKKTFRSLFEKAGFKELHSCIQKQPYDPGTIANKKTVRKGLRKNLPLYYAKNPSKFFARLKSLWKDGFCNKYLVCVFEKI